jgi:DNA-binding MarR family transcriptional regulator
MPKDHRAEAAALPATGAHLRDQPLDVPADDAHADDPVADVAYRLQISITRLARRLRAEVDSGLTPSQASALAAIRRHGPLTLGELAEQERIAPPSVTRMVSKLEQAGYVERVADPRDRRVTRVVATAEAEELVALARRRKSQWLAAHLDGLSEDDRLRIVAAADAFDRLAGRA